jgi:hypothetical protein
MKIFHSIKSILFVIAFILGSNLICGQILHPIKLNKLGLVSELTYIKLTAENHLTLFLEDTTIVVSEKQELVSKYLTLKTIYDQILLELIADESRMNSIKYFKKIDNALYENDISDIDAMNYSKKIRSYMTNLKLANAKFQEFIAFIPRPKNKVDDLSITLQMKGFLPAAASVEEITGVLSFISGVIKDVREAKGKKVDAINSILNDLRLSSIQELGKPKEGKDKKEDKAK